jgi:hypothetical protein
MSITNAQAPGTSLDTWMALVANCFAGPSTLLMALDELAFNDDTPGSIYDDGLCSTIVYTWTAGTAPSMVYLFIEGACCGGSSSDQATDSHSRIQAPRFWRLHPHIALSRHAAGFSTEEGYWELLVSTTGTPSVCPCGFEGDDCSVNLGVDTLNLGNTGSGPTTTDVTGSNIGAPNYFGNPSGDVWYGLPLAAGTTSITATTCECTEWQG